MIIMWHQWFIPRAIVKAFVTNGLIPKENNNLRYLPTHINLFDGVGLSILFTYVASITRQDQIKINTYWYVMRFSFFKIIFFPRAPYRGPLNFPSVPLNTPRPLATCQSPYTFWMNYFDGYALTVDWPVHKRVLNPPLMYTLRRNNYHKHFEPGTCPSTCIVYPQCIYLVHDPRQCRLSSHRGWFESIHALGT